MIQVLPFDVPLGRRVAINRPFTMLRLPTPGAAGPLELAYVEAEGVGEFRYLDDKTALARHDDTWTRVTASALSFEETRGFLRRMIDEIGD